MSEYKYKKETDWLQSDEEAYQRVYAIFDTNQGSKISDIAELLSKDFADFSAAWDLELKDLAN
ncbi:MAG TPA: hypothetical protein VM577_15310, partial [Anaerovoracaceae bacterium]|nr:hypothetical protein [Anaerovoracaceae bacterium]